MVFVEFHAVFFTKSLKIHHFEAKHEGLVQMMFLSKRMLTFQVPFAVRFLGLLLVHSQELKKPDHPSWLKNVMMARKNGR